MGRPRIIDAFPFAGTPTELLLLECRLTELYDTVDKFVIVEAMVDHQGNEKPLNFLDHQDQYAQWADKIAYVVADQMPTVEQNDWEWAREHCQREHIGYGLAQIDAEPDDILLQSDLDEIPRPIVVRNVRPQRNELIAFHQRGHFWAVDWEYPTGWNGTVATRVATLDKIRRPTCGAFAAMRDVRNTVRRLPNAGWHFSWLGNREAWTAKSRSFCHQWAGLDVDTKGESNYRDGVHTDGTKMVPVTVDRTWPKWIQDRSNVPDNWYRPRP